jgi:hypothetical protein
MQRRSFLRSVVTNIFSGAVALPFGSARQSSALALLNKKDLSTQQGLNMDVESLKTELDEAGLVIIPELIPRSHAEQAAEILKQIMKKQPDAETPDQHLRGVFNHLNRQEDPVFLPLVTHPVCLELAQHALGNGFQMTEIGARWRRPGCRATDVYLSVPLDWMSSSGLPVPNVCFLITFSWMLTDLTRDMGATFYLPYSHHAGRAPRPGVNYKYQIAAEGPAGSVVVRLGGIWHSFGANTTRAKENVGLMGGYFARWMNPQAVDWKLMKRAVRDRLPENVQAMNQHVAED